MNDMDQDDDDVLCSDVDDPASETDSKKEGSRGTSRGSSSESKSHGNSSKPRRYKSLFQILFSPIFQSLSIFIFT